VLANDTDADGDTLTASLVSGSGPNHGTLVFNSDGSFTYTPTAGYIGTDSFQYKASDGAKSSSAATVTLNVTNSAPVANNDSYDTLKNTPLNMPAAGVLGNDFDPDGDPITAALVSQAQHGSVSLNANGSFTYTPNTGYTGSDSFTYQDSDGYLNSTPATVSITVTATNGVPVAVNDGYQLAHDTSLTTDAASGVLANDSDSDGDTLTASLVGGPAHGTLTLNVDGSFAYTPAAGYTGTDSFTYQAFDGTAYSGTTTASLTVTNDVPVANPDSYSLLSSGTTTIGAAGGVLANDSDGEDDALSAVLVTGPAHGTLMLNTDGSFSYTPGSSFAGADLFTYEAYDGVNYSSPATVSLTSGPVASGQSYVVLHDRPFSASTINGVLVGAYDFDGDALTAQLVSGPSHGTLTLNSDGSFTYTPAFHYLGGDSFTFQASDGAHVSNTATANLNVIDHAPQGSSPSYDTPENTQLVVGTAQGILANAYDPDLDAIAAGLTSGPANGTLDLQTDGAFTYTPKANWYGTDTFTFIVTDGLLTSGPITATIVVNQEDTINTQNSVPSAVAIADFNGDGKQDVALADRGLNLVSVYLGDGSGAVATSAASQTTVGTAPVALAVGDFNGDGKADLAVANSGSNNVSILLGNGDATFTTGTALSTGTGSTPSALAVGDFNGDGKADIVVANQGLGTVEFFWGNGNCTFTAGPSLTTGSGPDAVAAADLNGDGKLDLVVGNGGTNTLSVFLGNGNGTFGSATTVSVGTGPASVAVGDLNSDGKADIAVANSGSNSVSVLLGNGDGTFGTAANYAVGMDPVAVLIGNFNGDGYLDLSVANYGSSTLSSLLNWGDGTFFTGPTEPVVSHPAAMAVGDLNGDGLADQAIALADPGLVVKDGTFKGTFTTFSVSFSPDGLSLAGGGSTNVAGEFGVKIWNPLTGAVKQAIVANQLVSPIAYSPDSKRLAIAAGPNVALYDLVGKKQLSTITMPGNVNVTSLSYSPSGTRIAAGSNDGLIAVFLVGADGTLTLTQTIPEEATPKSGAPYNTFYANYGSIFIVAVGQVGIEAPLGSTRANAAITAHFDEVTGLPDPAIQTAAASPDGKYVAVGFADGMVGVYNWGGATGELKLLNSVRIDSIPVTALTFFSNTGFVARTTKGATFWNIAGRALRNSPTPTIAPSLRMLASQPDGSRVAASTGLETAAFQTADGTRVRSYK
jgi:VCBS repeat-containing protein